MATTTPRAVPLLRRLLEQPEVAATRGTTADNKDHLASGFYRSVQVRFGRFRGKPPKSSTSTRRMR